MRRELFSLAVEGIKGKRRSSLLLFWVLVLSFAFAVITLSVTGSMDKTNEEYRYDTYGTWYGALLEAGEEDGETLREYTGVKEVGSSCCYGTTAEGTTGIGTLEETLRQIGRIDLQEGHFPQKAGEIAMEADVLSMLGYDYELGQEITLMVSVPAMFEVEDAEGRKAESGRIGVEQTYQLCGVLQEYTNLWFLGDSGQLLNGAVITEAGAERLMREAEAQAEKEKAVLQNPTYRYFFTAEEGREAELRKTLQQGLLAEKGEAGEKRFVVNTYAFQEAQQAAYHSFYLAMILGTTLLAVVCIYMVQLQKQVRQIALFRSIGITKEQLSRMLFYETLCISVPAAVLGTLLGAVGTLAALTLLMNFGKASVYVTIPFPMLFLTVGIWLFGIFAVRLLVFQTALRQPLTGRIHMGHRKAGKYRRMRGSMTVVLASVFCASGLFGILQSLPQIADAENWGKQPAYGFTAEDGLFAALQNYDSQRMITEQAVSQLEEIPGIWKTDAYVQMNGELKFAGMETNAFAQSFLNTEDWKRMNETYFLPAMDHRPTATGEEAIPFPEGIGVNLYGIREENWQDYFDIEKMGIEEEAFREGRQVLVCFPADIDGEVIFDSKQYSDFGLKKGDCVELGFYGKKSLEGSAGSMKKIGRHTAEIGGFLFVETQKEASLFHIENPYTIVGSEAFVREILAELEPGYICGRQLTGSAFGYTDARIYTTITAGYLSTDYLVADLAAKFGLELYNSREQYAAYIQEDLQNLILILSGSGSICLILLLIFWNTLRLEAEEEKRSFGILQAIGMSVRQMRWKLLKRSLAVACGGILSGWLFYGVYVLAVSVRQQRYLAEAFEEVRPLGELFRMHFYTPRVSGAEGFVMFGISAGAAAVIILVYHAAKRCLFRNEALAKLREEGQGSIWR